jgi:tRNA pseudouridine38-40 synthase
VNLSKNDRESQRNILLTIEYDGVSLFGSQRQREGPTVQSLVEEAVEKITGERAELTFSGRTDRGVHGAGMLAVFQTASAIPAERFPLALSACLPPEVAVTSAREMPADFHPRKAAKGKLYRYRILNRPVRSPHERDTAWHVAMPLDVMAMREAARHFVGTKDFRSFTAEAALKENTVRTLTALRIRREGDIIVIDVEGEGFLHNMVRAIVGSLVEVGRGKEPPGWVLEVLEARDRRKAGPTAPPQGLSLIRVLW